MDVTKILADLRQEQNLIQQAINILERLARGGEKLRGRPPAWLTAETSGQTQSRSRRTNGSDGSTD